MTQTIMPNKSPSLRNLAFTLPYTYDGRFSTLDKAINHYREGLQNTPTYRPTHEKSSPRRCPFIGSRQGRFKDVPVITLRL